MPNIEQSSLRKKDFVTLKSADTGDVLKVVFPNGIQVGIPGVDLFNKGIVLPNLSSPPADISNTLYVINGNAYFNGQLVGTAGGANVTVKDEGNTLVTTLSSINFVGSGVTATASGNDITVTTPADGDAQIIASQVFG